MCPGIVQTELFAANEFSKGKAAQKTLDEAIKLTPADIAAGCWFMIDQPPEVNVKTKQETGSALLFSFRVSCF